MILLLNKKIWRNIIHICDNGPEDFIKSRPKKLVKFFIKNIFHNKDWKYPKKNPSNFFISRIFWPGLIKNSGQTVRFDAIFFPIFVFMQIIISRISWRIRGRIWWRWRGGGRYRWQTLHWWWQRDSTRCICTIWHR